VLTIAINGITGRMGQQICHQIKQHSNLYRLSSVHDIQASSSDYVINNLTAQLAEVVIDFSTPLASLAILKRCVELKLPLVIGTTGFTQEQMEQIHQAAKVIPLLFSPNMSLSVTVLSKICHLVAKSLPHAEVEIIESHHRYKKDAPSGTALRLGESVASARGVDLAKVASWSRDRVSEDIRPSEQIGFSVVRGGDIVGRHQVEFILDGEILSLNSDITNRASFAQGALQASLFLIQQSVGLYNMEDVLQLHL
jgi:4-hydroxy-tetrahydrodipicolinate reductase